MSCVSYCLEKKLNVGISISTLIIFRKKKREKKSKEGLNWMVAMVILIGSKDTPVVLPLGW
jgi:hypothetical protein